MLKKLSRGTCLCALLFVVGGARATTTLQKVSGIEAHATVTVLKRENNNCQVEYKGKKSWVVDWKGKLSDCGETKEHVKEEKVVEKHEPATWKPRNGFLTLYRADDRLPDNDSLKAGFGPFKYEELSNARQELRELYRTGKVNNVAARPLTAQLQAASPPGWLC